MANFGRNIGLVWMYGKWMILVGGLYNLACTSFLAWAFSYMGLVTAFILKIPFTAVLLYLHRVFENPFSKFVFFKDVPVIKLIHYCPELRFSISAEFTEVPYAKRIQFAVMILNQLYSLFPADQTVTDKTGSIVR